MLPFALVPFIPAIQKTVLKLITGDGFDKKDVRALSKQLYSKLPSSVKIVDEKNFVEFCLKHQDKIFPQKKTAAVKRAPRVKSTSKTVVKATTRKPTSKKVSAKKK